MTDLAGAAKVFLSYAHEDLIQVTRVYEGLAARGLDVWFDREHLRPGTWRPQIIRAITQSRYFVACLSRAALRRLKSDPGFQETELATAYRIAFEQAENRFAIVPIRLEDV